LLLAVGSDMKTEEYR